MEAMSPAAPVRRWGVNRPVRIKTHVFGVVIGTQL